MTLTAEAYANPAGVRRAMARAVGHLIPPPEMLPTKWAESNVKIPVGNAIPGKINFDNAPYQRGMLDAIKEAGCRRIDYMTGAQLGKTTVQQCIAGYFIEHEPRSQIFAQPTQGDMQTFMETKLRPMLDANPKISRRMAKQRGRHGVNNGRIMSYVGGWMMMSWAGSPKTARGRSAPVTQQDEIDGYDVTPEGDFCELLSQRGATFGDQQLDVRSSTPTLKGESRIENGFIEGDQRRYYVPCPHCGEAQHLKWAQVMWEGRRSSDIDDADLDLGDRDAHKPETAGYICEACGLGWSDGERIAAVRNAEKLGHGWKASKPWKGHASFHAPELLSTFRRLRAIVQSYLSKLYADDLQSFVNVSLALTWEEKGEKADPDGLMARREEFAAVVPMRGLYLTCGVDMQEDRLELEIVAWGQGEESWSVDYRVLWGDPLGTDVWDELDEVLAEKFRHETGAELAISATVLDTGGSKGYTQRAYDYCKGKTGRRLFAGKGQGGWGQPIVQAPQRRQSGKNARKVDLFLVGTDEAKLVVTRRLAKTIPGPGFCHFPDDREYEWFKQITAEKLKTRYLRGQPIREWWKPDRARNEALDCRVYALAALKITQPSFKRLAAKLGVKFLAEAEDRDPPRPALPTAAGPAPQTPLAGSKQPAPLATPLAPPSAALARTLAAIRQAALAADEITQEEPKRPARETDPRKRPKAARSRGKGGWVRNY